MNKKIILIIIASIIIGSGGVYFYLIQSKNDSVTLGYYEQLEKDCNGNSCCIESVKRMKAGGYKLVEDLNCDEGNMCGTCPEGYNGNMLKCIDSYQWCEPVGETKEPVAK